MEHEFIGKPSYTLARIRLTGSEKLLAEAGAMAGMSSTVNVDTSMKGGFLASAKRSVMGGESFFMNTFSVEPGETGRVDVAPSSPGDMIHLNLDGELGVQSSCFVAADAAVDLDASFEGFKGFFSGMGLTMLRLSGTGDLFLSAYGGVMEKQVSGEYVVDTGHVVAFDRTLDFDVERVGGWGTTFLSGEGLVCRFHGEGTVYVQTRSGSRFASWIHPFRRVQSSDD